MARKHFKNKGCINMSKILDGIVLIGAGVSALVIGEFIKRKLFKNGTKPE